ncbi:zinc-binding dehydrogenase [Dactylosporangium sp. NPDC051541]|uniref:zinc-binding dehydrogenase n=1 Tax=Dactylosporangium sp. NPDC051541 TaxID=3363977 RepID=UPI0037936520
MTHVVVRNHYLALGAFMHAGPRTAKALGEIVVSNDARFPVGTAVTHRSPWASEVAVDPAALRPARLDDPLRHLGGALTALTGLRAAGLRAGETVYVTGAAGGVGSAAGLVARALGAGRVIGSSGSAAKVTALTSELGYDAAFDHSAEPMAAALDRLGPPDVVFDTLGRVDDLVPAVGPGTRIALCGALAQQLGGAADPRLDLNTVIFKRLSLLGFTGDPGLEADLDRFWPLPLPHTIVDGLAAGERALADLVAGRHTGLVLVRAHSA